MTLRELAGILLRRWWLIVLVPAIALPLMVVRVRMQPYQTTMNAVVLIPFDTEDPGNSERPELMVMDDLSSLVGSKVFAESVAANLPEGSGLTADDVHGSISATRYSRVVTISVEREDAGEARVIAESAAAMLPSLVNQYLIADPTEPATVQIIDPPGDPTRSRPNQMLILAALMIVALAVGVGLALAAYAWQRDVPIVERRGNSV
jgi:capsular polysaccharide biosynthesis protein